MNFPRTTTKVTGCERKLALPGRRWSLESQHESNLLTEGGHRNEWTWQHQQLSSMIRLPVRLGVPPESLDFKAISFAKNFRFTTTIYILNTLEPEKLGGRRIRKGESITSSSSSWDYARTLDIKEWDTPRWNGTKARKALILRITILRPGPRHEQGTGICFSWHPKVECLGEPQE